ncbi:MULTISPECIES: Lrp/AsnC family transcriptional regulator [Kordiimonas]|uniref:Lrp/AsnC family transcriptional regulator n=1 Tax=Kordiimonas TaxID=288021 RepID=UPI001FF4FE38|nr:MULTISPECIES: Lrp/AsnC family transcriptional regulator [Kordiimonas]MCK0069756.1 Lrp/AsnC family transcriptional regulator [Kordiimonas laminariae]UTW57222.1 Lrp/AsnC family transcriptional regulator [Kordiimonas sp. SCSIO 12603]
MIKLDKIDHAILDTLQKQGKLSNVELAEIVGLSESACLRRVKNLHEKGVVTHYAAHLDAKAIGLPGTVFVRVSLEKQQEERLNAFEEAVKDVPEVMECYLMGGDVDYMIRVVVKDAPDYERVHNILTRLPGVARVHSSFALRTVLKRTRLPLQKS